MKILGTWIFLGGLLAETWLLVILISYNLTPNSRFWYGFAFLGLITISGAILASGKPDAR
jgi:hypothetical protein